MKSIFIFAALAVSPFLANAKSGQYTARLNYDCAGGQDGDIDRTEDKVNKSLAKRNPGSFTEAAKIAEQLAAKEGCSIIELKKKVLPPRPTDDNYSE